MPNGNSTASLLSLRVHQRSFARTAARQIEPGHLSSKASRRSAVPAKIRYVPASPSINLRDIQNVEFAYEPVCDDRACRSDADTIELESGGKSDFHRKTYRKRCRQRLVLVHRYQDGVKRRRAWVCQRRTERKRITDRDDERGNEPGDLGR